jgi:hypothetical protein
MSVDEEKYEKEFYIAFKLIDLQKMIDEILN